MTELNEGRVIVAMIGARMHYAVPRILNDAGLLKSFYTDAYLGNKRLLPAILRALPETLQKGGIKRWLGRDEPALPADKIISFDSLGYWFIYARSRAADNNEVEAIDVLMAQRLNKRIIRAGLEGADYVYGFNGAAVELFEAAKKAGARCILEQTILSKRQETKFLATELERWPGWEPGLKINSEPSPIELRESREWELADHIVTASDFVRSGLITDGVPAEKIHVVPYGVDAKNFPAPKPESLDVNRRPLRVLFAGQVGLRKGAVDLIKALSQFSPEQVEAKLAGSVMLEQSRIDAVPENIKFLRHVARSQMYQLFLWADIFVLPSIVEGSATVTYEALMMGVPVVTTANAGSIVRDSVDGFIVPIRDPDALAQAIGQYCDDRQLLAMHSENAVRARDLAGLNRYRDDLLALFKKMPEPGGGAMPQ